MIVEERKMTWIGLARKSGIGKGTISRYRHKKAVPDANNLIRLADALGVDAAWLWRG